MRSLPTPEICWDGSSRTLEEIKTHIRHFGKGVGMERGGGGNNNQETNPAEKSVWSVWTPSWYGKYLPALKTFPGAVACTRCVHGNLKFWGLSAAYHDEALMRAKQAHINWGRKRGRKKKVWALEVLKEGQSNVHLETETLERVSVSRHISMSWLVTSVCRSHVVLGAVMELVND